MKTMTTHSSAAAHEATPHVIQTTRTVTIINALKRRAQAVLNDKSVDAQSRAIIRYGLETNDPWLAELVRRSDANNGSCEDKLERLVEMICGAGESLRLRCLCLWECSEAPYIQGACKHSKALSLHAMR
jgi:hypothetical protein